MQRARQELELNTLSLLNSYVKLDASKVKRKIWESCTSAQGYATREKCV